MRQFLTDMSVCGYDDCASVVDLKFLLLLPRVQRGTSDPKATLELIFASVPLIPKFASGVPHNRANFGIGTLAFVLPHKDKESEE